MAMAPYQRIVEEIRGRIASGALRPGDRVPSARQITQEWGVAIATATKVLATLRAEGLARPVVGVGTVVGPAPVVGAASPQATVGRRGPDVELSRERVVRAAVAIADAEGIAAVTMRRLAAELDVGVMSLYRHVPGKDELVMAMADSVFGEQLPPDPPPDGWRAQLETIARMQWAMGRAHPWIPSVMSLTRPLLAPNGMAQTEWVMRSVHDLGFDLETSLNVAVVLAGFVLGVGASVQSEADAQQETGLTSDEWMVSQEDVFQSIMSTGRYPLLGGIAAQADFDLDLDVVFELGLQLILDGLAHMIESR